MRINITFFLKLIVVILTGALILIVLANIWVINSTKAQIHYIPDEIPPNNVGLVLGTSKYYSKGKENLFFRYRIDAAIKLYRIGAIKHILVSGDSSTYYNEPKTMKKELLALGIPESAIILDNYGFRTYDSVLRSKIVYGQKSIIIITQDFYAHRALFICKNSGINAVAFATKHVPGSYSFHTLGREYLSRCKAIIDLFILQKRPRYVNDI